MMMRPNEPNPLSRQILSSPGYPTLRDLRESSLHHYGKMINFNVFIPSWIHSAIHRVENFFLKSTNQVSSVLGLVSKGSNHRLEDFDLLPRVEVKKSRGLICSNIRDFTLDDDEESPFIFYTYNKFT